MRRAAHVAVRYERARIYEQFGITTGAQSRDEQLITQLPETFWWEEVADLWNVKRRAAVDACDDDGEECSPRPPSTQPEDILRLALRRSQGG